MNVGQVAWRKLQLTTFAFQGPIYSKVANVKPVLRFQRAFIHTEDIIRSYVIQLF